MSATIRVLFVFVVGAGLVGVPTARADEKEKKPPAADPAKPIIIQLDASKLPPEVLKELLKLAKTTEPSKPGTKPELLKPGAEPSKPGTKPEVTKPGSEPSKPGVKPETSKPVKTISLSDAIAIAEKSSQGTVVKAERKEEDGTVQFRLDVLDGKGNKSRVTLDAGGKVTGTEKKGDEDKNEKGKKKEDEKGKGKKKEKDD